MWKIQKTHHYSGHKIDWTIITDNSWSFCDSTAQSHKRKMCKKEQWGESIHIQGVPG